MDSPATKGTVCIACLLGRSLKPDSAWMGYQAGKEDHLDNKLLQGRSSPFLQVQLQILGSSSYVLWQQVMVFTLSVKQHLYQ